MSSKLRPSPSTVVRLLASALATTAVVLGFMAPWTLLSATARAAGTPASEQADKAAGGEDGFSYSDLRAAIGHRAVKSATLWPSARRPRTAV